MYHTIATLEEKSNTIRVHRKYEIPTFIDTFERQINLFEKYILKLWPVSMLSR